MRWFFGLILPLIVQVFAFMAVFVASRGGGSFMGLFALPVAPLALIALIVFGIKDIRSGKPLLAVMSKNLSIAVFPPVALLLLRALES